MKKMVLLFLILLLNMSFAQEKIIYNSATEFDFPPFSVPKDGKADGFSVELLKAVADETDIKIDFKVDYWDTIIGELRDGKVDLLPVVSRSEERDKFCDYSNPYIVVHANIYVRKDNKTINSEADLFGKEIIVMKGEDTESYAIKRKLTNKLILAKSHKDAFELLNSGKYDAIIAPNIVGMKLLSDFNYTNLMTVTKMNINGTKKINIDLTDYESAFCFAVKKGDKKLLDKLNEGLAIVSINGKYQKIYEKWFPFLVENKNLTRTTLISLVSILVLLIILIVVNFTIRKEVKRKTKELLKEIEEKKKSEERLNLATHAGKIGIWDWNIEKNELIWDDSMYLLYGIRKEDFAGAYEAWSQTLHLDDRNYTEGEIQAALNGEREYAPEFRVVHPDGAVRIIKADSKTIRDHNGKALRMIGTNIDITEQKKAELILQNINEELKKSKEESEKANIAKSQFLANMSHEIRTPLNSVIGFSELLEPRMEKEQDRSYLKSIRTAGKTLLTLINDILDLSKIEAGKLEINEEPSSIYNLFQETIDIFKERIQEKGIDFLVEIEETIPETLILDEVRLRQVLFNLIGNAVKFTESGYIKLKAWHKKSEEIDGSIIKLYISVEDTGVGMTKEYQKNLFQSFTQQDVQTTRKYGGTGLGLAITKRLLEMMRGKINVVSEKDKGSCFEIELDKVEISIGNISLSKDLFEYGDIIFEKAKVLVVDDIKLNRDFIKGIFSEPDSNITVFEAQDGAEAVEAAGREMPDIILMDIRMPVMDGKEAAKLLKRSNKTKDIKIIALTASVIQLETDPEMEMYFDGFLRKPARIVEIYQEMMKFIKYTNVRKRAEKLNEEESNSFAEEKISDEILEILSGEYMISWKKVMESQFSEDIKHFAEMILKIGNDNNINKLVQYVGSLLKSIDSFDVVETEKILKRYPEIVNGFR